MKIRPGYKIIHSKYGEGTILSVGRYADIQFGSKHLRLLTQWVEENCKVVAEPMGGESLEKWKEGIQRLQNAVEMAADSEQEKAVENFRRFHLSERGMRELADFFSFWRNYDAGHKRKLRYHLLIQCENDAEAVAFIQELEKSLKNLGLLPQGMIRKTEEELQKDIPDEFPLFCSALAVHNCSALMKDSVRIMSSSIRGNLQKKKSEKDLLWEILKEMSDLQPDCLVIAAGPRGFVDYIRENDELYYRFFAHHIILRPMTLEEVTEAVYQGIEAEELTVTEAFRTEMDRYIQVVYPKADLRDTAFVEDLLNRILVNYYISRTGQITEDCVPFYRKPKTYEEISERLNQLVGLEQVKGEFQSLYRLSQDPQNRNQKRLHFVFAGNPGTGKTTVAGLTAELLYSMGLIRRNKLVTVTAADVISVYRGESAQLMREKIEEARGGVMFIDEAYFLTSSTTDVNSPQKQCLDVLIQEMEQHEDELSVILAGYEEEMERMLQSNAGLASRVPYVFHFEDYTEDELLQIFLNLAEQEGMSLAEDAKGLLAERISMAKTEEHFGNARTVANLYQQLKAIWLEQDRRERVITAEDVRASMPAALDAGLDQMIGLESVKRELAAFESRVRYIRFLQEKNLPVPAPNLHMMFTGNPGTGKTTVAKRIADCLYQIGVLKTNKLVVAERKDLVDVHVGGTALKTQEVIRKSLNGVLFVDEAYALTMYGTDSSQDSGKEAIATLITAMEEHRGNWVVIFAGYQKEMEAFRNSNPGIASRIGFTFHFPDYTPAELTEMFGRKMEKNGFLVNAGALEQVQRIMEYFSRLEDFGNGRFVDKVMDLVISRRSQRSYARRYNDISAQDIPEIRELIQISPHSQVLWTDEDQSEEMRRRIAVHEAGHALVSRLLWPERKLAVISIQADAGSMGKVVGETEPGQNTESNLKAQLAVLFGGRNAERLVWGEHSTGCQMDMEQARQLASYMIRQVAMGELGVTTELDLLREADQRAEEVLAAHKKELLQLADCLVEKGIIDGAEWEDRVP